MFAKLSTDVTFEDLNGHTVTIPAGCYVEIIWVSRTELVASALGLRFDIDMDELVAFQ